MHGRWFRAAALLAVLAAPLAWGEDQWETAIAAFEAQDAANPPAKGGIVFVGSSSIRFWKTGQDFPELGIINRGFGGSHTSDAVRYVDRIVIKYEPRLVVFYEGDNDLSYAKTPQTVLADTIEFFEKVHAALPETRIIYVSIKPSIARWGIIDKIRETNGLVRDYAARHDYIHFLDVEPVMLGEDGKPKPELFIQDGLHMNQAGYDLWNKLIEPLLTDKSH
jgi:lysophospholipase L1-like esterase